MMTKQKIHNRYQVLYQSWSDPGPETNDGKCFNHDYSPLACLGTFTQFFHLSCVVLLGFITHILGQLTEIFATSLK